jgi:superoxide reductase
MGEVYGIAELGGVYKCEICGNVVSVIEHGVGVLVCCGQNMTHLEAKTSKVEGKEKHVPVIEVKGKLVTVTVGSVPHPMEEAHFIVMIQLLKEGKIISEERLYPGQAPTATFVVDDAKDLVARAYCNVHGLWTS